MRRVKTRPWVPCLRITLFLALVLPFQPDEAPATPVVDIIFTATSGTGTTGGASIEAAPGDTLTVTISLTADAAGISSYSLSSSSTPT